MTSNPLSEYLAEFIDGTLDPETYLKVEQWLAKSVEAQQELAELQAILDLSAKHETLEPSAKIREQFFAELSALEALESGKSKSLWSLLKIWVGHNQGFSRLAYSGFVFVIGLSAGLFGSQIGNSEQTRLDQLAAEVGELKYKFMHSQLQHPATDTRLRAVRYGYELGDTNQGVLSTLFSVVNNDPSNHVRIAAAQVLFAYIDEPQIQKKFIQLFLQQDDLSVQLMLFSMLKSWDPVMAKQMSKQMNSRHSLTPQERIWLGEEI